MAYMDHLYRPENIIGYSGVLTSNPTVYFCAPSTGQNGLPKTTLVGKNQQILFLNGHITQAHDDPRNIGREKVCESWSYSIMNAGKEHDDSGLIKSGQKALQETYHQSEVAPDNRHFFATPDGFSDFHISRSTFTAVRPKDSEALKTLATAISKFPLVKKMYGRIRDNEYTDLKQTSG
ncbi:hypothetical protein R50072_27140 [Simiduia litorea]|uniref:hypothetical protein n=1 Tax=Simiduia litorea TaxID=1435348 RepID=UPI0036F2F978